MALTKGTQGWARIYFCKGEFQDKTRNGWDTKKAIVGTILAIICHTNFATWDHGQTTRKAQLGAKTESSQQQMAGFDHACHLCQESDPHDQTMSTSKSLQPWHQLMANIIFTLPSKTTVKVTLWETPAFFVSYKSCSFYFRFSPFHSITSFMRAHDRDWHNENE